ncbi:MAG: molybdopterin-dependent oxidoreductase [Anaerolineales bacterium]
MNDKISRRDFLKTMGVGLAVVTGLTGCGPASRYTTREPYTKMPEYTYNGQSTYYATTCRECAAGCGLVVRTMQGRALKVEGNPLNPLNLGKTCARGQAALHGLYNPDRIQNPVRHVRGDQSFRGIDWDTATGIVAKALKENPGETAFLLGLAPDHLFDLTSDLCKAIGAPDPIRYGALGLFEARATLGEAARAVFGKPDLLFFDLAGADVTFSFGSNFLETWLSPVAYTRGFAKMRQGTDRRGYLVQFEARMSQTGMKADEWIPVIPGTEGLVAAALGRLIGEQKGGTAPAAFAKTDIAKAAELSGVSKETLQRLATIFAGAATPLAIPGGAVLAQDNGLEAGETILLLNALVDNLGKPGGVYYTPDSPLGNEYHPVATAKDMVDFIAKMNSGAIKTLFVHGVNPAFELPKSLGFEAALSKVETVISFASFPDETAVLADYVFPDHTGLESFGYQRIPTGSGQSVLSGAQPAVAPYYNTHATVDVLLAAGAKAGGKAALAFKDEVEYIQGKLTDVVDARDGYFSAADMPTFWAKFQQFGGWWQNTNSLGTPSALLDKAPGLEAPTYNGDGDFHLVVFPSPTLGEAGANKPWLQELPDPSTTVTWNSWVEINPKTAEKLGIEDDDVVEITSSTGLSVKASVYKYPAIRPDTIAIPFGQGHSAYGRYASGRGINPTDLLSPKFNNAGDLAYASVKVKIKKTGEQKPLARFESALGVYGFDKKP